MSTQFNKLNEGWNAAPSAPPPSLKVDGNNVTLTFAVNPWQFTGFSVGDPAELAFTGCWRYRLGPTNEDGWLKGGCRFSSLAPEWGEFYEVTGDLLVEKAPADWVTLGEEPARTRHFLFYFPDVTFECDAVGWSLCFSRTVKGGKG